MKLCEFLTLVLVVFLMGGCAAVYVPEPVGEEAVVLDSSWTGSWLHDDGIIVTQIGHAESGLLKLGWIEYEDGNLVLKDHSVYIRSHGKHMFASVRDVESDHGYTWMLVDRPSANVVVIWSPKAKTFRALISEGKLEGEILFPDNEHNNNVVLEGLPPELLDQIVDPSAHLLGWEHPFTLMRVTL